MKTGCNTIMNTIRSILIVAKALCPMRSLSSIAVCVIVYQLLNTTVPIATQRPPAHLPPFPSAPPGCVCERHQRNCRNSRTNFLVHSPSKHETSSRPPAHTGVSRQRTHTTERRAESMATTDRHVSVCVCECVSW